MSDLALYTTTHKVSYQPSRGPHCFAKGPSGYFRATAITYMDNGCKMGPREEHKMTQHNNKETNKILSSIMEMEVRNPFQNSGKLKRTPPTTGDITPKGAATSSREDCFQTPKAIIAMVSGPPPSGSQPNRSSPNQEFLLKMRKEEASAMASIKKAVNKIKAALKRQRNISMDVKEGVQEIEELICIAETSRSSWIRVEKERQVDKISNKPANIDETPPTSVAKRIAESPLEQTDDTIKKKRNEGKSEGWETVSHKRRLEHRANREDEENQGDARNRNARSSRKKQIPFKHKPEALIIKPTEGYSYADVLKTLRQKVNSETNTKVKTIRKTKTGAMLLELERGERVNPDLFNKVREVMKDSADVRSASANVTLNIRDLDALTTTEEVTQAIKNTIEVNIEEIKVRISNPNSRELVQAYVTMPSKEAEKLLRANTVKIGWCTVRVRHYIKMKKCFKCFGTGHEQWNCIGPDRRGQGVAKMRA